MNSENFSIHTRQNERDNLIYEDVSCVINCNIADFRDEVYWILILSVKDKRNNNDSQLTLPQHQEVLRRINYLTIKKMNT
ncbi:hypothetical protein [Enterococcus sp. LJL51]|uniref:hypothetical protein n=1 Tax=Enterococcus sp. LJL51 TaxID=3416656 RepID=UPI003CF02ACA